MNLSPEVVELSTKLASVAGRMTVEAISDKIRMAKQKGNKDETINNLEEIINDLISDKNQLIQISQSYEEKLITQRMTEKEIEYITDSVIPLIETLIKYSDNDGSEKIQESINLIKPILSKETFNIMQILGFNFRQAIGEPLTELMSSWISSKVNNTDLDKKVDLLTQEKEVEYIKLCQDEESYKRLMNLYGRE